MCFKNSKNYAPAREVGRATEDLLHSPCSSKSTRPASVPALLHTHHLLWPSPFSLPPSPGITQISSNLPPYSSHHGGPQLQQTFIPWEPSSQACWRSKQVGEASDLHSPPPQTQPPVSSQPLKQATWSVLTLLSASIPRELNRSWWNTPISSLLWSHPALLLTRMCPKCQFLIPRNTV